MKYLYLNGDKNKPILWEVLELIRSVQHIEFWSYKLIFVMNITLEIGQT